LLVDARERDASRIRDGRVEHGGRGEEKEREGRGRRGEASGDHLERALGSGRLRWQGSASCSARAASASERALAERAGDGQLASGLARAGQHEALPLQASAVARSPEHLLSVLHLLLAVAAVCQWSTAGLSPVSSASSLARPALAALRSTCSPVCARPAPTPSDRLRAAQPDPARHGRRQRARGRPPVPRREDSPRTRPGQGAPCSLHPSGLRGACLSACADPRAVCRRAGLCHLRGRDQDVARRLQGPVRSREQRHRVRPLSSSSVSGRISLRGPADASLSSPPPPPPPLRPSSKAKINFSASKPDAEGESIYVFYSEEASVGIKTMRKCVVAPFSPTFRPGFSFSKGPSC